MEVEQAQQPPEQPHILDVFDIAAYAAKYTGRTKIDRLLFIAKCAPQHPASATALKMAIDEIRQSTLDSALYREAMDMLGEKGGAHGYHFDPGWVSSVDAEYSANADVLEQQLNTARANLDKDAIRAAYSQLGDLYFRRGDMTEAFRQHIRTRDYSTAPLHVLRMCLAVVRCALAMSNYLHVHTYVAKAEGLGADEAHAADDLALPRLRCASGLAQLAGGRYRQAAKAFTSLPAEIGDAAGRLGDVACGADVATYGALCALASFERAELGSSVIENASFRHLLASAPGEVNEAVTAFYGARYGDALAALARVRPALTLDPYVSGHLDALLKAARARALTQYSAPFATLDLRGMARAFETDVESLEDELAALISTKQVSARIDSHNKVLRAHTPDPRSKTFSAVFEAVDTHISSTKQLLLRASMMRHDLVQRASAGAGGGAAAARAAGGGGGAPHSLGERGREGMGGGVSRREREREGAMGRRINRAHQHQ